jgi:hypothetical protein
VPFKLSRLVALRPVLFHLTRPENLEAIRARRQLVCAAELFAEAGEMHRVREHRGVRPVPLRVGGHAVLINDQRPLRADWIDFDNGWDLARLIEHLNRRVFFWPGTARGPNTYGQSHATHYERCGAVAVRVKTRRLLDANPAVVPEFCRYNSGAPSPRRRPNPRGGRTFLPAETFDLPASGIAEVTFPGRVELPGDALVRATGANWEPLFG